MKATDGDQKWEWTKKFTIEGKEAKKLNDTAVEAKKDYTLYYIIGGTLLLIALLVLVFLLGRRSKKKRMRMNKVGEYIKALLLKDSAFIYVLLDILRSKFAFKR